MSEALSKAKSDGSIGRLGRYALLQNLAKGGMAQVFIAQKDGASEVCVLKQLLLELEEHEIAGKRFHREAHVASFLNHPNIARILDAGLEDNTFCIAFEYIAGKDGESMMHRLLSHGRMLPYEVSLAFGVGVLQGLAYAHEAKDPEGNRLGLVHRDLSPRNMMLSFSGDVKIIDFGLAHGQMGDFKTAPGMVLGTLRYVSPEQALTDPIDRRSDLYSISVVLHEMLSGRWVVQPGKPFEVLKSVISDVPPMVTELNPHLPAGLGPVIAKGMAKAPEERWQTAGEYLTALKEAAGPLARTEKGVLGEFISDLFPEDAQLSSTFTELGRKRFETRVRGTSKAAPVRPVELSDPDAGDGQTRTGYLDQTRLAEVDLVEPMELTRTAGYEDQTRVSHQDLTLIAPQYPGDAAETLTAIREFSEPEPNDPTNTAVPTIITDDGQTLIRDRTGAAVAGAQAVSVRRIDDDAPQTKRAMQLALALAAVLASAAVLGFLVLGRGSGMDAARIEPIRERPLGVVPAPIKAAPPRPAATAESPAEPSPPIAATKPPSGPSEPQTAPRTTGRTPTPTKTAGPSSSKAKTVETPVPATERSDGGVARIHALMRSAELDAQGNPTYDSAEKIIDELRAAAKKHLPRDQARTLLDSIDNAMMGTTPKMEKLQRTLDRYKGMLREQGEQ